MNAFRTGLLMATLTAMFLVVGYLLGGRPGMVVAFCFATLTNLWTYWNSDKTLLSMYGAREAGVARYPGLIHLITQLASKAGLPTPKLFVVDNRHPNAFAAGRNPEHASICVTTGLLARVSYEELAGVLAHELGHVKHRDTLTMTITAMIAGAISNLADFASRSGGERRKDTFRVVDTLLMMLLAPIAAVLGQIAVSRMREFDADRAGAVISGSPLWLASALQHIDEIARSIDGQEAEQNPDTVHMIVLDSLHDRFSGLFASHPPMVERIARLNAMDLKESAAGPWA